jgi:hypothetical protein
MSFFGDFLIPLVITFTIFHIITDIIPIYIIPWISIHSMCDCRRNNPTPEATEEVSKENLIKIAIKHAGSQYIDEFRSGHGEYSKTIYLTFDKTKTIKELKEKITKLIKYSTVDSIILFKAPFGKKISDSISLSRLIDGDGNRRLLYETQTYHVLLFIVIENY